MNLDLLQRLTELPYRFRARTLTAATTWALEEADVNRVKIVWPRTYQWPGAIPIVSSVKEGLASLGVLRIESFPQSHKGVVMLQCVVDGRRHSVVFDYSDYPDFVNNAALDDSDLYFKCQFREGGYADVRIIRAGYHVTFVSFYKYYAAFRAKYSANPQINIIGRFGFAFQPELRKKAVRLLTDVPDLGFVGATGKVRYSRFLKEAASARLSLHLPGNGPFTHRVAEFLGLGTCMISPKFTTQLHVPLEPGVHYVDVADDLSDLVDKCRYYLANNTERERISHAGTEFFDRYLHCDQLAAYHVRCILDHLGTAPPRACVTPGTAEGRLLK